MIAESNVTVGRDEDDNTRYGGYKRYLLASRFLRRKLGTTAIQPGEKLEKSLRGATSSSNSAPSHWNPVAVHGPPLVSDYGPQPTAQDPLLCY